MGKIKRRFDVQFKIQVCRAIEVGTHTVLEICQNHQLQKIVVEAWLQKYLSGTLIAKANNRQLELERENEKLKAKVGELTMQIDLLKKMENWKKQQTSENSSVITSKNLAQFQKAAKQSNSQSPVFTTNRKRGLP